MAIRFVFTKIENGADGDASGTLDPSTITGLEHSISADAVDELTFSVHFPASGRCDWLRANCTLVEMYDGSDMKFRGRITSVTTDQNDNGTKNISCEGEQAFLKDSFIFPGSRNPDAAIPEPDPQDPELDPQGEPILYTNGKGYRGNTTGHVLSVPAVKSAWNENYFDISNVKAGTRLNRVLDKLVLVHNAYVCSSLRVSGYSNSRSSVVIKNDHDFAGKTTFDVLCELADDVGMEWRAGHVYGNSQFIIEFAKTFGTNKGDISTGLNLKAISKSENLGDVYTAILPLGGYGYDEKRLSLSTAACNESSALSGLNSGNFMGYSDGTVGSRGRPYIKNNLLVRMYGLKIKVMIYDDIVVNSPTEYFYRRNELLRRAQQDAADLAKNAVSFSADAFDFEASSIGGPGPELTVYDYYNVKDYVIGINVTLRLIKKVIKYDDILNPSLTFELDDRTNVVEPIGIANGPTESLIIYNEYTGKNAK